MNTYKRALASVLALALGAGALLSIETVPSPSFPDGTVTQIDLPSDQHMTNVGGSDTAGLCVPTSITVAAKWQNLPVMFGYRKFTEGRPGGSYPEKTDADLKVYASRNGVTIPNYVQHTGGDELFLQLLLDTRRMPGITYAGHDDYYDHTAAHMVNAAHLDAKRGAIVDNNRAGRWVVMSRKQLLDRWRGVSDTGEPLLVPVRQGIRIIHMPVGGGWAFAWLGSPPPPKPPSSKELTDREPKNAFYAWEREILNDDKAYWFLYENGNLIFVVDPDGKWHKAIDANNWDVEVLANPPSNEYPPPTTQEFTKDDTQGVSYWKLSKEHRFFFNGVECSRGKAVAAVLEPADGGLVDDSDKFHLTLIVAEGTDPKTVTAWFSETGPLAKYKKRVHVQAYKPSDWPVGERVSAAVTLQEPAKAGGRVTGSNKEISVGTVGKLLSDTFDAPPPIVPDPMPPKPPAPVAPAPVDPVVPDSEISLTAKVVLALLLLLAAGYVYLQETKVKA